MNGVEIHKFKPASGLILVIPLLALTVVTQLYVLLPVASKINSFLEVSSEQTGLLTTLFGVFYATGFLVWGGLSDKYGRERIIKFGLVALCIITFTISFLHDYSMLLVMRCLQGFVASSYPPVILAWIAENYSEKSRRLLVSLLSCSFLLAGTLGQLYGTLVIESSLSTGMMFLAIVYFSGAVFFHYTMKGQYHYRVRNKDIAKTRTLLVYKELYSTLIDRKLSRVYMASVFVLMSFVSLYYVVLSNSHIINMVTVDISTMRNVATIGMLNCLTSGYILKKLGALRLLFISLLTITLSLMIQIFIVIGLVRLDLLFFYFFHYLFTGSVALAIPAMITCVTALSNNTNRGGAISLYTCILFVGASLGSYFPGVLNIRIFFSILIAMLGVSAVLVININKRS
jgi:YNFM family putative membrane transporter